MLKYLLTFIAGALLTLAFAPFAIWPLGYLCPAVICYYWLSSTPKESFWLGFLFGFGLFLTGVSWLYISIHNFGGASSISAGLITLLAILYLSLYPATQGYLFNKIFQRCSPAVKAFCLFPSIWALSELARTHFFTGFPWLFIGYSQMFTLHGFGPIVGVYGLSFLTALGSGGLAYACYKKGLSTKVLGLSALIIPILISWPLNYSHWTKKEAKAESVAVIQGNVPQGKKWSRSYLVNILNMYADLVNKNLNHQIILLPEAAMPTYADNISDYLNGMSEAANKSGSVVILGVPIRSLGRRYNGLMMIGKNQGRYLKRHLVPFGEYTPRIVGFIVRSLNFYMAGFSSGPDKQPLLKTNGITIAPFICYEVAYSQEVLDYLHDANLIVTVSDNSWFGRSIALDQQLQMTMMRSIETGRYSLAAVNTGISAIINPHGRIVKASKIDKRQVLTAKIYAMTGETPLMRWGYWPLWILCIVLLGFGLFRQVRPNDDD